MDKQPIHDAAFFGDTTALQAELNKNVDVNQVDTQLVLQTPLHYAAMGGRVNSARLLIAANANVDKQTSNAQATSLHCATPLHYACAQALSQLVDCLLDARADVNKQNSKGESSLMLAITGLPQFQPHPDGNRLSCVKALLAHKADIALKSKEGHTALELAKERKMGDVVALLEGGASPTTSTISTDAKALATTATSGKSDEKVEIRHLRADELDEWLDHVWNVFKPKGVSRNFFEAHIRNDPTFDWESVPCVFGQCSPVVAACLLTCGAAAQ